MPNNDLMAYIAHEKSAGVAPSKIVSDLRSAGWPEQEIQDAMGSTGAAGAPGSFKGTIDLLKEAVAEFRKRWKTFVGITLLPSIIGFIVGLFYTGASLALTFSGRTSGGSGIVGIAIIVILNLLLVAVSLWSQVALMTASVNPSMRMKESYLGSGSLILGFIWISLLTGVVIALGVVLLLVPGIIVSVWWMFSQFILVAEGIKGTAALRKSRSYVRGRWWAVAGRIAGFSLIMLSPMLIVAAIIAGLLVMDITGMPLAIVMSFAIGLGILYSFIAGPLGVLYTAALYRTVREASNKS